MSPTPAAHQWGEHFVSPNFLIDMLACLHPLWQYYLKTVFGNRFQFFRTKEKRKKKLN